MNRRRQFRVLIVSKFSPGGLGIEPYYPGEWRDGFELGIALSRAGCDVTMATPAILPAHRSRVLPEILPLARQEGLHLCFGKFPYNNRVRWLSTFAHTGNWLATYYKLRPDLVIFLQARPEPGLLAPGVARRAMAAICDLGMLAPSQRRSPPREDTLSMHALVPRTWQVCDKIARFVFWTVIIKALGGRNFPARYGYIGFLLPAESETANLPYADRVVSTPKGIHADIAETVRAGQDRFDVVFCGMIGSLKGVFDLVDAFHFLPSTTLGIIGTGSVENLAKLREATRHMSNVHVLGSVGFMEKYSVLKAGRVFVLPTLKDFYPSVILEAMACGLPVITTNCIPSPVMHRQNGLLVEPGRPEQLAMAIRSLLDDEPLRAKLAQGALETARNLSWDAAVRNILELLGRIDSCDGDKTRN